MPVHVVISGKRLGLYALVYVN